MAEEDWDGWARTTKIRRRIQLVVTTSS